MSPVPSKQPVTALFRCRSDTPILARQMAPDQI